MPTISVRGQGKPGVIGAADGDRPGNRSGHIAGQATVDPARTQGPERTDPHSTNAALGSSSSLALGVVSTSRSPRANWIPSR